jgi:hypothetical protein
MASAQDVFVREVVRAAIAGVCADIGFTSVQHSALDTFADVVTKCTPLMFVFVNAFCKRL